MNSIFSSGAVAALAALSISGAAQAQLDSSTTIRNGIATRTVGASEQAVHPNYVTARPRVLPGTSKSSTYLQDLALAINTPAAAGGQGGYAPGDDGDGVDSLPALFLGFNRNLPADVTPNEFGSSQHPFSTARADLNIPTNKAAPYRSAGRLFFNIGSSSYVCSASLIRPGLVVTAAHCVSGFNGTWYTNVRFVPAYRNGIAPYGTWAAANISVMTSYFNGTDSCSVSGVVCRNDVAVIQLALPVGVTKYVGTTVGYYGYAWDGYGFNSGSPNFTHITQLGYPVCLDNGQLMQRNDSHGYRSVNDVDNTVIGSLMCGGSSGGPWLANFGVRPALTATTNGTASDANVVVGVTSRGYNSTSIKQQGASRFTANNIVPLVAAYCPTGSTQKWCK